MKALENSFKSIVNSLTDDGSLAAQLWLEIEKNYSKKGRHYHTLSHLDALFNQLQNVREEITDWNVIILSIAYHDIVYNALKGDNEERSAKFASERIARVTLTDDQREKCAAQILATKNHRMNEDSDTNYFTDADLAILGSTADEYQLYTHSIRKEYKIYPDIVYRPGRKKVLQHFLDMPRIFKTDYFNLKFEQQARVNMKNELNELTNK